MQFCSKRNIEVPDMDARYKAGRGRVHNKYNITIQHHYQADIFIATLDSQLHELNARFSEHAM